MAINNINKDFEADNCYGSGSDIVVVFFVLSKLGKSQQKKKKRVREC